MIPHASEPFLDAAGRVTRSWRTYLSLLTGVDSAAALQEQLTQLGLVTDQRLDALEAQAGVAGNIIGVESILTTGTLADGTVYVKLRGDAIEPGTTRYYGTGPDGTKGWHAIADALDAASGELVKAVDPDTGVTTLGLAELPDTGGGELRKIDRDEFGRVAGTSTATTDDLAEGSANLYYTDARVDARIAANGGIQVGEVLVADGISPPVMLTDDAETDFIYQG